MARRQCLFDVLREVLGGHSLVYFVYTCDNDLFIWGVILAKNLAKNIIRWWYFTCKKPENIICDGILHVNMFHFFKIPYFTCTFFTKFIYNEYIGPYFLSHVVSKIFASEPPEEKYTVAQIMDTHLEDLQERIQKGTLEVDRHIFLEEKHPKSNQWHLWWIWRLHNEWPLC